MSEPAVAVAGPTLVTETSARFTTVEFTLDSLFDVSGSGVPPVLSALAVLVRIVPSATSELTCRINVNVSADPDGSVEPSDGPESCTNETSVVPGGGESVVWTLCASSGPALLVVMV